MREPLPDPILAREAEAAAEVYREGVRGLHGTDAYTEHAEDIGHVSALVAEATGVSAAEFAENAARVFRALDRPPNP